MVGRSMNSKKNPSTKYKDQEEEKNYQPKQSDLDNKRGGYDSSKN